MAKTLTEAKIAGRSERKRLPLGGPYWRGIDPTVHLGYRKGPRGGKWVVRWYDGQDYQQRTFATADDELTEGTLDYNQAIRSARELVETERRQTRAAAQGPSLTVRQAIEAYTAARDERDTLRKGRQVRSDASSRLGRHVVGHGKRGKRQAVASAPLADIPLHDLSEDHLIAWRSALPETLRGATKQRLINDLKAALNAAYATNRARLPSTLPGTIKHGLQARDGGEDCGESVARPNQILSDEEVTRLISAARQVDEETGWEGDLFRLIAVLAATGMRFSQVVRMRVGDVQADMSRLMVPVSRKGRGKTGSVPVRVGADILEVLLPAHADRATDEFLLERWRSKQVAGSIRWERAGRGPWRSPSELGRPWRAIAERAGMPEVIPYALRHSSVVRSIRVNVPVRLVAARHDTSVAMIERHYGRYIADGLDELAARAVVPLIAAGNS